jgi:hypothetical protein
MLDEGRMLESLASIHHDGMSITAGGSAPLYAVAAWAMSQLDLAIRYQMTSAYNRRSIRQESTISAQALGKR